MIGILLLAQLASAVQAHADSAYATEALRALVAGAAVANHAPPPELRGYHARVETELSLIIRDTLGRERTGQVEQLATNTSWQRSGAYDIHVVGYRSQSTGVPYSALSIVRGWTVPTLYGERLYLGADFQTVTRRTADNSRRPNSDSSRPTTTESQSRRTYIAVHPFARDRERFYRFTGGDTVTVLRAGDRAIPIVRIHVTPHIADTTSFAAFDGEIDIDASRHQIVRMRGRFVVLDGRAGKSFPRLPGMTAVAYAEFVNAEIDGKYWLPASQRTEFQAQFAVFGKTRSVFRLVSRFGDYGVDAGGTAVESAGLRRTILRVTWAPQDSIGRFDSWRGELGNLSSSVRADDFDDVGPDEWRTIGAPRLDFVPTKASDIARFNRVEGLYTGLSATLEFRDLAPGLRAGVFGGFAWAERTMRGGARLGLQRAPWSLGLRAERALISTNDFTSPMERGRSGPAFAAIDDNDYVDRSSAMLSATRFLGGADNALATVQLGFARDAAERARLTRGLYRPNSGAATGSYAVAMTDVEFHPNVTGDFVQPGIGARIRFENAVGGLAWQRAELALSARRYWGPMTFAAHADGGIVLSREMPPQTLFEMGGGSSLPGYDFKEFAGDRAALFRSFATYRLPVLRTPQRVFRNLILPAPAPGFGIRVAGGWTELSSDAARRAVDQLGADWSETPVSRATGGVRATVGVGATLFSDLLNIGVARPVDHAAPWRFVVSFGQGF